MTDLKNEAFALGQSLAAALKQGGICILTGAGISAESGIKTFRDMGGTWERYRIEEVATPEAFFNNAPLVYDFYNTRQNALLEHSANAAHHALAKLQRAYPKSCHLITQNVDDLHERGGYQGTVWHMHGELQKQRCAHCAHIIDWKENLSSQSRCESCGHKAMRPHIVWFGEMPFYMDEEIPRMLQSSIFVSIGTSGTVYPAAGFVATAQKLGAQCVELNLEASQGQSMFDHALEGKATELVPAFVDGLID